VLYGVVDRSVSHLNNEVPGKTLVAAVVAPLRVSGWHPAQEVHLYKVVERPLQIAGGDPEFLSQVLHTDEAICIVADGNHQLQSISLAKERVRHRPNRFLGIGRHAS
jgi:hypothetical protein